MKLKQFYPHPITSYEDWIDQVPPDALSLCSSFIYEKVNENFPLSKFLRVATKEDIYDGDEQCQVSCFLTSHGSMDSNKSARYFREDRETGEVSPAVYCYKCSSVLHTFGYVYTWMKQQDEKSNTRSVLKYLLETFSFTIPIEQINEYEVSLDDDSSNRKRNLVELFSAVVQFKKDNECLSYLERRTNAKSSFLKL